MRIVIGFRRGCGFLVLGSFFVINSSRLLDRVDTHDDVDVLLPCRLLVILVSPDLSRGDDDGRRVFPGPRKK